MDGIDGGWTEADRGIDRSRSANVTSHATLETFAAARRRVQRNLQRLLCPSLYPFRDLSVSTGKGSLLGQKNVPLRSAKEPRRSPVPACTVTRGRSGKTLFPAASALSIGRRSARFNAAFPRAISATVKSP